MTERETILMIQVILSYVEDIGKGKTAPGPFGIRNRLRMYDKNLGQALGRKTADRTVSSTKYGTFAHGRPTQANPVQVLQRLQRRVEKPHWTTCGRTPGHLEEKN